TAATPATPVTPTIPAVASAPEAARADVTITGPHADPEPDTTGLILVANPDLSAPPANDPAAQPAPHVPGADPARGSRSTAARIAVPERRPHTHPARWQPLAAALIVVGLWHLAVTALEPLFVPEPWALRSLAVAAVTLLIPGLLRTAWPHRSGAACALALAAGAGTLLWCWRGTGAAQAWISEPITQLRVVGAVLRDGVAPLTTAGVLGLALCLVTLLLAWACALMSASGGDRIGLTGLAPAAALLAPGMVLGRAPDDAVILTAAAGVLALMVTSAPAGMPPGGRPRRTGHGSPRTPARALTTLVRATSITGTTALAVVLAIGALSLAPTAPTHAWNWDARGPAVSVPDTTLRLGENLVRGTARTAFEYTADGVAPGTSLRFTLGVIRDLDGEAWEPLAEPVGADTGTLTPDTGADTL
ncbi:transglutaminaseTgpA domain-containing protein, partial [Actinomyces sp. MRS3W]|uniref:transglutaminaseTgpA domain-containing protein n=1 Tax=Actinomyces sp. MRS3W TaxID=2800796 RepID=UPI0028FD0B9D